MPFCRLVEVLAIVLKIVISRYVATKMYSIFIFNNHHYSLCGRHFPLKENAKTCNPINYPAPQDAAVDTLMCCNINCNIKF